jgi:hypothetical protein
VSIEKTTHSRKPERFYEIIEALYPKGRRLELFHRGELRPGWQGYGYESQPALAEVADAPPLAADHPGPRPAFFDRTTPTDGAVS